MALRLHTKWNTRGPKSIEDRAGAIAVSVWKIANETWKHMEKEGFHPGEDRQLTAIFTEQIAFLLQITDRLVYGQLSEDERARLINAMGQHLAKTMQTNMLDMFGPGDYTGPFIQALNARSADYAECEFENYTPSYAFLRVFGQRMAEAMSGTDNKWAVEYVMDIEAPEAVKNLRKLVGQVLGIKVA